MTALDIPCKRPGVPVVVGPKGAVTYCTVTGCDWEYGPGVKTDVEQHAKWHRAAHRAAVPKVDGHTCECGWQPTPGTVTKTDRDASLAHHLSSVHGLVS